METLSFKQKLGVLSVVVVLIGIAAFMSTKSNTGLRSDVFNNPEFICGNDTLTSQKAAYDQNVSSIASQVQEKAEIQALITSLSNRLDEENSGLKALEKEKNQTQNAIKGQQAAIK